MKKFLSVVCALVMVLGLMSVTAYAAELTDGVFEGTGTSFGGDLKVAVTVEGGKITKVEVLSHGDTAGVCDAAMEKIPAAIVEAQSADVDVVTGATWTSKGAFAAIKKAMGVEEESAQTAAEAVSATGLSHGLGLASTPRLGPGKDDQGMPVYSFNEVVAYVITDAEQRIVDLEVDILEIITPNHDAADDNYIAGWPGSTYNDDHDADGKVDGVIEETTETFVNNLTNWATKRDKGDAYKMNSGTWEQEMDAYESIFKGMTISEVKDWVAKYCSDLNGRALHSTVTKEADVTKWNALTDEEKAAIDAVSAATMSVNDAHGDIIAAIENAINNQQPITVDSDIASMGLGVVVTPRLGPGKDDQGVPVYSFNVVMAGSCYDAEGKTVALAADVLEIITPNHDGADDNVFTGWPGQSYNNDADADGKVDGVLAQTEDTFVEQIKGYTTKRSLGDKYKMNSGTWKQEMEAFEAYFTGKTADEISAFFTAYGSDVNGRILRGTSDKEADVTKWNALTSEQQAEVDALSGATMSLRDGHGDILGAIEKAWKNAKACLINVK